MVDFQFILNLFLLGFLLLHSILLILKDDTLEEIKHLCWMILFTIDLMAINIGDLI